MANPDHVAILKTDVSAWNLWLVKEPLVESSVADEAGLSFAKLIWPERGEAEIIDMFRSWRLRAADLSGADLSGQDLNHANLHKADLSGANFRSTNLRCANLNGADVRGADFREAKLSGANFSEADLSEADLSEASVGWTVFANVNLTGTKGLETVKHEGPSSIGMDTIYKSQGKIPDVFLRGAGVPDTFISYVGALVGKPIEFYSCFISYSHADKLFARRLHDTLQGRGIRCWLDEHQLLPGDDIYDQVDRGISLWDKVLLCCSKASLSSWWVDNEIGKAFAKEQSLRKERRRKILALIPLNIDGELFAWQDGKADEIRRRLAANFTDWERDNAKFDDQIERVARALRTDDGGREQPPKPLI